MKLFTVLMASSYWRLSGKLSWCREEALSTILSVEFVDLPVSQIMAKMEDEFGTNDGQYLILVSVMLSYSSRLVMYYLYWVDLG